MNMNASSIHRRFQEWVFRFHITQPGPSVATSLIDGESKPKHVLLLEIKGSQYRPTKIPLKSVRPFEYAEVVLKDEADVDPNDQASVLEHLHKVVRNLIEKSRKASISRAIFHFAVTSLSLKNGTIICVSFHCPHKIYKTILEVDYTGFSTINPQRFGQKYVGKVANPQDILIFSKAAKKRQSVEEKLEDSERLHPEELNQQNIEALVAESNLKMEILPVNDLDIALHDFVNKDDKTVFYSCLQYNLKETRNKLNAEAEKLKVEEEDIILKVGECMQERVKERSLRPKENMRITSSSQIVQEPEETFQEKGRKRAAPRGRGRGSTSSAKRGRKSDVSSIHTLLMNKENDDDNDDNMSNIFKKAKPWVSEVC
ncbi:putative Double-strand break repair protein MRE11 [Cocos nucifera]|nr:putative Double-strand break repair protein MRE11 [Cocos nucifera]